MESVIIGLTISVVLGIANGAQQKYRAAPIVHCISPDDLDVGLAAWNLWRQGFGIPRVWPPVVGAQCRTVGIVVGERCGPVPVLLGHQEAGRDG